VVRAGRPGQATTKVGYAAAGGVLISIEAYRQHRGPDTPSDSYVTSRDGTVRSLAGPTARHRLFAQECLSRGLRNFAAYLTQTAGFGQREPYTVGHNKIASATDLPGRRTLTRVWRVKNSNLGRHQPMNLQNSAHDVLTSYYAPATPVRGPNRARPSAC
jgi:hypothetical protein